MPVSYTATLICSHSIGFQTHLKYNPLFQYVYHLVHVLPNPLPAPRLISINYLRAGKAQAELPLDDAGGDDNDTLGYHEIYI